MRDGKLNNPRLVMRTICAQSVRCCADASHFTNELVQFIHFESFWMNVHVESSPVTHLSLMLFAFLIGRNFSEKNFSLVEKVQTKQNVATKIVKTAFLNGVGNHGKWKLYI